MLDGWINKFMVFNSIFLKTEGNYKFKVYLSPELKIGGYSYANVREEIEKDLEISDTTGTGLQDELIGPIVSEEYRKEV